MGLGRLFATASSHACSEDSSPSEGSEGGTSTSGFRGERSGVSASTVEVSSGSGAGARTGAGERAFFFLFFFSEPP